MMRVVLLVAIVLTVGCRRGGEPPAGEGSAASPEVVEGAHAIEPGADDASGGDEASAVEPGEPTSERYLPPAPDPTEPPPDLVTLMRAIGYADAVPADLAEFVHVPPGAEGEAGSFADGEGEVRVALVRYPNPRYARPHRTDVEERRRVVADLGEAVAQQGRFVVHVRAGQRARADEVVSAMVEELGWDEVSDHR